MQLRDAKLLPQNENHRVVAESATRVHRDGGRLIDHKHFAIIYQNLQWSANYRGLVAVYSVPQVIIILCMVRENLSVCPPQTRPSNTIR